MYEKTTLDNGLRVLTAAMPHTRSVSINFFIGAGSRYEQPERAGVSHFIEHLAFKGTQRRPTTKDISEAIEGVGGLLNAGTDRELTVYWCKVARPHLDLALDVLVDMLRNSKYEPEEIERERKVIIEELNMSLDSPRSRVGMLIDEVVWPAQALGRDVVGTKETVSSISRAAMLDYLYHQYAPNNTVVSIAGEIDHDEVVARMNDALADWPLATPVSWYPVEDGQGAPRFQVEHRETEQAHLCLALHGLPYLHPDRYTLDLLDVILGQGMSSRLFLEIRERRGLAYDVHSFVTHYRDAGALTVYAGVDPKQADSTLESILAELNRLKEGIPEAELTKAKELSKGRLLLRMEDTRSVAGWIGAQELLIDRIRTVDDVIAIIDSITAEDLQRVARELLTTEKLNLALVGPFDSGERFQALLKL